MQWLCALVGAVAVISPATCQNDAFALPQAPRFAPKPTVPPEYSSFFELDGHARELVDSLLGPRPGGLFPEKAYEIGAPSEPVSNNKPVHVPSTLERTLEQFFTAPEPASGQALPPGFGSGFALLNNNKPVTSFGSGNTRRAPEVPEGGFLPAEIRRAPQSVSNVASSVDDDGDEGNDDDEVVTRVIYSGLKWKRTKQFQFGGLSEESSTSSGGLIGTIFNLISMTQKKAAESKNGKSAVEDKNALGKAVSNLIGGENSPLPAKNMISNVLYKALTSNSVQPNDTLAEHPELPSLTNLTLTPAQSAAITENLEMVQNFIIQPSSPLCTHKPEPVGFELQSFMGQWYQIFEYTTDGTPYGKPKISSGYAMIKSPGELIYRTTSNQEDVNVHVLYLGPLNSNNEYEYVIMSTNCNFPLYVFARDPVVYKQRYESDVNAVLERKGLVNGISRLLNIVAPVESSLCTFPPSLFNIQG
ncbi:hypothetical protein NECAME_01093 [Necator americanus]|uniref:Lipocalin domain-containing protein n=1 Tax=Necator americanus TaxID=51031 RepID=W2SHF1_NECAM|nr:hypothetical protein NECAME_01093 [Necator americanus]ETN68983.1 hypothetical protein NECAME_01093 [Necator americanus]